MTKFKMICMAMALGLSLSAHAIDQDTDDRDYKPYPYMFVGLQGGVQSTLTDYNAFKLIRPTASVSFGRFFTPIVGARLHVNGLWNQGGIKDFNEKYDYKYATTDIDLMLNLTNMFGKKQNYLCNVILLGGMGMNYAWDNDDMVALKNAGKVSSMAWTYDNISYNARVGVMFDFNVCKHWGINLEVAANSLSDKYNSKITYKDDWQITAQLGIAYKFGFRKNVKPAPVSVTPVADYSEQNRVETAVVSKPEPKQEEAKPEPKPEPKPVVVKEEALSETMFYAIRESDPDAKNTLSAVIAWGKKYPNKKISVSGYADKGTGNPTINRKYAQQRVDKVVALLKKGGIPVSQIEAKAYGDTVQPFAENNQNRCVIIVGK